MPLFIFVNKRQFPFGLVFLLCASTYLIWNLAYMSANNISFDSVYLLVFHVLVVAFFAFRTIIQGCNYCYAVFSKRSVMVVDNEGIEDKLTLYSLGRIHWSEVRSVDTKTVLGIQVLLIYIDAPTQRIAEQQWWKRLSLNRANKRWGTPVLISQRLVDYDITELASEISERLEKAKQASLV